MWITQLVIHHDYRGKGYATTLLRFLIESWKPSIVGVASAHPHTIMAVQHASTAIFDESFIQNNLLQIIKKCNIPYLTDTAVIDIPESANEPRFQVDTQFYADHSEPLKALHSLPLGAKWPLGPLLEGHEFIVIFLVGSNRRKIAHEVEGEDIH